MDCSLPGFSVHGISQARILEWVANPGIKSGSPALVGGFFFFFFLPLSTREALLKVTQGEKEEVRLPSSNPMSKLPVLLQKWNRMIRKEPWDKGGSLWTS